MYLGSSRLCPIIPDTYIPAGRGGEGVPVLYCCYYREVIYLFLLASTVSCKAHGINSQTHRLTLAEGITNCYSNHKHDRREDYTHTT